MNGLALYLFLTWVAPAAILVTLLVRVVQDVHRRHNNLSYVVNVGALVNIILFLLWVQDWTASYHFEGYVAQNVFYALAMIRRPLVATIVRTVVRWMVHVNAKRHTGLRQSEAVSRHMGVFMLQDLIDLVQILLIMTLFPITFFADSPFMILYFPFSIFVFFFNMISVAVPVALHSVHIDIEDVLRAPDDATPESVQ